MISDAVFDTTVVAWANKDIATRKPGNSFDRRLGLLELVVAGRMRIRYNSRLLTEYGQHVRQRRNDVIEFFFTVLDSASAIRVPKNNLSRQQHRLAIQQRWPTHDQHLLAAALGGDRPCIYVTEKRHANCAFGIHRVFGIGVRLV